ncbi:protein-glucosylgalactosylhydroxylysine glucosidase-like isoform X2 [Anneissia japonica]|uniref:protein-glucosylgalactosylhydroxylysine glucosidase-like isoform X2 n=1 Tax=Anneissia japonica TaxID=1529436 RepID=UPI0014255DF0|nr:protein-glucosylgalactosylhydroxylysine glucosidase-like isoform X2 [Anneissia japonica]
MIGKTVFSPLNCKMESKNIVNEKYPSHGPRPILYHHHRHQSSHNGPCCGRGQNEMRGLLQVAGVLFILLASLNVILSLNTQLLDNNHDDTTQTISELFYKILYKQPNKTSETQEKEYSGYHHEYLSDDPTVFTSSSFPANRKQQPSIGNGYLATVVYSNTIFVNGLYNGKGTNSHRARVPSTAAITASLQESASHLYTLNVRKGIFVHEITTDNIEITHSIYAHQVLNRLLVNQITINRKSSKSDDIVVKLDTNFGPKSFDINFSESPVKNGKRYMHGRVKEPEHDSSEVIMTYVYWTDIPSYITLPKNASTKRYTFITSISKTDEDANYFYTEGIKMDAANELFSSHVSAWKSKWQKGHIDIDNNIFLSRVIYSSMYYILSSLPPLNTTGRLSFPFYGLAPGGLANGAGYLDYMGHVFWDQETWMYPPMLLLYPSLAKAMLSARTKHIDAAKDIARSKGYNGTMFPWEMAYSGYDVCPDSTVGNFEQHVNGDIAYALQQYVRMTEDVTFLLEEHGFDLAKGLAEFWFSRAEYNGIKDRYEINGVMPPDEYHSNVNNSAYTNLVAKISLLLPEYIAQLVNSSVPASWNKAGNKMYIPYDDVIKYHPEYDGYQLGTFIKQADVILLGFPLMYEMPVDVKTNDLLLYDTYKGKAVTNRDGPAMTWAMFTINWLKLKNFSKAENVFNKTFANLQGPFMTWTENPDGSGAVNFQTGMGGFLQTIMFGFGGIRIGECLDVDFVLPPKSSTFNITGLNYLGSSLNFVAQETSLSVTLTEKEDNHVPNLQLIVSPVKTVIHKEIYALKLGVTVNISRVPARVCKI